MKEPKRVKAVIFHRAHASSDTPDLHVYHGHEEDALFDFVFQTLGYGITIVESDGQDITAREM